MSESKLPAHRIRLPQPWSITSSCVSDPNRADARVTTHEFSRSFQRPGGLAADSLIEIQVVPDDRLGMPDQLSCSLNGQVLAMAPIDGQSPTTYRAPVDLSLLQNTNSLRLNIQRLEAPQPEPLPQVCLVLR